MKRRLVQVGIIVLLLLIGAGIFVKYFPQIWGEAVYPLEYKDEILASSNEFGLERNFIAAVIFTESRFNKDAVSRVGARGLMQLMPATARGVANSLNMTDFSDSRLNEPAVNIRLGSAYLKQQFDKYNGNYDAILAHYNGGPGAAGILLSLGQNSLNRETNGFVSKVKNIWQTYDNIYGKNWEGGDGSFAIKENNFVDSLNIKNLFNFVFK
ncbi:MAG: Transglycosylase SLT domain protein [Berkelbacteria bacterium GW2011_GWA2_35_9]|uniref:Transglycosylase SLT domain protein n=1 Tax=Berkelbacteria bacterium GW2011_GWA2_35_9 TaxID=1618333 RepID=A0A0G0D759_9BACT|nr:MAG: Transglycosylase SLT domain protein [Berkelbacteria bacterium GW2011_GWA2_35_9]